MSGPKTTERRSLVRRAFRLGLLAKAADGVLELAGGVFVLVLSPSTVQHLTVLLTRGELAEDPHDLVANALRSLAAHLSTRFEILAGVYLLVHGITKLGLVAALWREWLPAFPLAILVFSAFAAYQIDRYMVTHSLALLALTGLDVAVIGLTLTEWRRTAARAAH